MSVSDARCDRCGLPVSGLLDPESLTEQRDSPDRAGIRFSYHPGDISLIDDSGILCVSCWLDWTDPLGEPTPLECAICAIPLAREESLFLRPVGAKTAWQLCATHAADQLNQLLTVEPKLDRDTFHLPLRPPLDG